ncbi:hypothetical protein [Streptomyces cuspidosporus]
MSRLDELWATAGVAPVGRVVGEPAVRAQVQADIQCPD